MGNAPAALTISLDTPAVYAGWQLNGRLLLLVERPIDAARLEIAFEGTEKARVHYTASEQDGDKTVSKDYYVTKRRTLLRLDFVTLKDFGGQIAPGRYEFPFSAALPSGLPSSMYASGGGGECRVAYHIVARLNRRGGHVVARQAIDVHAAPLARPPQPFCAPPRTERITACCCVDTGEMTFAAGVSDTLVSRGGRLEVGVAIRNDSTSAPTRVLVELREHVRWRARGRANQTSRVVGVAEWRPAELQGARALTAEQLKARVGTDPAARALLLDQVHAALGADGDERRALDVARDARDTLEGALIAVRHELTLQIQTAGCVKEPSLELPVRIAQRAPADATAAAAPPVVAAPAPAALDGDERATAKLLEAKPADWDATAIVAPVVALPMHAATRGGRGADDASAPDGGDDAPPPYAAAAPPPPGTLAGLRALLEHDYDDVALLQRLATTDALAWGALLRALEPPEFAELVARVRSEFEQPRAARVLGAQLAGGVTVAHIVAAARAQAARVARGDGQSQAAAIVLELLPLCAQCKQQPARARAEIEAELTEWERTLVGAVGWPE